MSVQRNYESVTVSTRIRLARNFADYPFPARLAKDGHAEEQAGEIIRLVEASILPLDDFLCYDMRSTSEETAEFLMERNLISRDLVRHRAIAAAFVSRSEDISVMVNEEDHIREQYFMKGFELQSAYERICGIDEAISDSLLFACDEQLGYLTACPTNLGTGLRASVMLFLPALVRRGILTEIIPGLKEQGLAVRGGFGEGSASVGDMYQISNEVTLGCSEEQILEIVGEEVNRLVEFEIRERVNLQKEGGRKLEDEVLRSFGILTNCRVLGLDEFTSRVADVKLGVALGVFGDRRGDDRIAELDDLLVEMRPASLNRLNGRKLSLEEQDYFRAQLVGKKLKKMQF